MNNTRPFTGTSFEVDPYPDYRETSMPLLGIYAVECKASFEVSEPFALIIAESEEDVLSIALAEGITQILNIKLLGYALPKYKNNHVVYLNNGEYLTEERNN